MIYDGTYFKLQSDNSQLVPNHTLGGDIYTTNSKYAIKTDNDAGWLSGGNLWYSSCAPTEMDWSSGNNYCLGISMRLPALGETTGGGGQTPACGWSYTSTGSTAHYVWYGGEAYWTFDSNTRDSQPLGIRCVR